MHVRNSRQTEPRESARNRRRITDRGWKREGGRILFESGLVGLSERVERATTTLSIPLQTNSTYQLPSSSKLASPTPRRLSQQTQFHPSTNTPSAISCAYAQRVGETKQSAKEGKKRERERVKDSDTFRYAHTRRTHVQSHSHALPASVTRTAANFNRLRVPTSAYYIQANTVRPASTSEAETRVHRATTTQTFFYVCTRGCARMNGAKEKSRERERE